MSLNYPNDMELIIKANIKGWGSDTIWCSAAAWEGLGLNKLGLNPWNSDWGMLCQGLSSQTHPQSLPPGLNTTSPQTTIPSSGAFILRLFPKQSLPLMRNSTLGFQEGAWLLYEREFLSPFVNS